MSDAELFLREAELLERRRRVLRSMGALGAAAVALAARCPRCSVGLVGKGRHCQRCGFQFEPDGAAPEES